VVGWLCGQAGLECWEPPTSSRPLGLVPFNLKVLRSCEPTHMAIQISMLGRTLSQIAPLDWLSPDQRSAGAR
jgi:hypothetical protein